MSPRPLPVARSFLPRFGMAAAALAGLAGCAENSPHPLPEGAFLVQDQALSEMSGLEASVRDPGVLWSINDSGSRPRLFRLGRRGEDLGRVAVRGTSWLSDDWETLAMWREGSTDWLLLGDVGDNKQRRPYVNVYAVREPAPGATEATVEWTLRFRYPDGPRDAEGITVDPTSGSLLVLSKRESPQRLYRVPLSARGNEVPVLAEAIAELPPLSAQATGLDITHDGRALVVLTYAAVYVWPRIDGQPWASVLSAPVQRRALPPMSKAEAMATGPEPGVVYVGSERLPTPLLPIRVGP
ncbi:hypothetical protein [Arenimonas metalli]|uniref:Lipoprotein LpqB beta-propeller domain-containing protein n=1 Tax=Arenimonas metalli CF5-1 TaxID=1384056 RepID=A0A091B8K2_9GAMM|nr:hypothetical protein [Arenimonas metalli]KFN48056.1 hypothetical protein N787_06360 [Arenimonas metalli CF5-1]